MPGCKVVGDIGLNSAFSQKKSFLCDFVILVDILFFLVIFNVDPDTGDHKGGDPQRGTML